MRLAIAVALSACSTVDLASRPQWDLLPSCLVVNATPISWQREHVAIWAFEWNDRLKREAIHVAPDCEIDDELVPFSFVRELPGDCTNNRACTYSRNIVNGVPGFREVVIDEWAPFSTIGVEIGHLVGCHREDLDPPCVMGVL